MSGNKKNKVLCVVGARPNFIKIAPLLEEFKKYPKFKPILVHTGQHYDYEMSEVFFKDLNIPKPNYNLGIGSGSQAEQTGKVMMEFEKVCLKENPNLIIKGQVTEEMIARAKEYPFENLIQVNKAGFAKCPFHKEKTASLYLKNNFYYCFGCGVSGDVIDFVMKTKNLSFIETVKLLQW